MQVDGLQPASQYEFRLAAKDREGKISLPSQIFVVETKLPWTVPGWIWRSLIIAALALVVYVLQKIRRGEFELEF